MSAVTYECRQVIVLECIRLWFFFAKTDGRYRMRTGNPHIFAVLTSASPPPRFATRFLDDTMGNTSIRVSVDDRFRLRNEFRQ
jgi:hypothetical protein